MARSLAMLVFTLVLIVAGVQQSNPLADRAARYAQQASIAAVATYATLRSMSALLSVLKDADLQVSVVVTSATVSPGQVLEPLTRTLERFADVMFMVALVSATLAVLLGPAASVGALAAAGALLGLVLVRRLRGPHADTAARTLRAAATVGLVFAVAVPLVYDTAFALGDRLTARATERATALLQQSTPEAPEAVVLERGVVDRIQDLVAQGNALLAVAGDVFQATLDLSVAYFLKLIVLPVVLIATGWLLLRAATGGGLTQQ